MKKLFPFLYLPLFFAIPLYAAQMIEGQKDPYTSPIQVYDPLSKAASEPTQDLEEGDLSIDLAPSLKRDKKDCLNLPKSPSKELSTFPLAPEEGTQKAFLGPEEEKKWWYFLKVGNVDRVKKTLACFEVDLNKRKKNGALALNIAANTGRSEFMEVLIKAGADVDQQDKGGWTALHVAASQNYQAAIIFLIGHGAEINKENTDGFTPLHVAVSEGWYEATNLLLEHGADVNQTDNYGYTPLDTAVVNKKARDIKGKKNRSKKDRDNERIIALLEGKQKRKGKRLFSRFKKRSC